MTVFPGPWFPNKQGNKVIAEYRLTLKFLLVRLTIINQDFIGDQETS